MQNDAQRVGSKRPGCVTVYVLLMWFLAAIPILVMSWFLIASPLESVPADSGILFMGTCLLPFGIATVPALIGTVAGIGLWLMKRWGLWLLIVQLALVALFSFVSLGALGFGGLLDESTVLILVVVGLLANGLVLYWFVKNRFRFNGASSFDSPVTGKD